MPVRGDGDAGASRLPARQSLGNDRQVGVAGSLWISRQSGRAYMEVAEGAAGVIWEWQGEWQGSFWEWQASGRGHLGVGGVAGHKIGSLNVLSKSP